jgi:hypothetical protein
VFAEMKSAQNAAILPLTPVQDAIQVPCNAVCRALPVRTYSRNPELKAASLGSSPDHPQNLKKDLKPARRQGKTPETGQRI